MVKRQREMRKVRVYYHYPCNDGAYAGLCAILAMRDSADFFDVYGANYYNCPWALPKGMDEDRDRSHWTAFCLDITPKPDVLKKLAEAFDKVVVLDHHATANEMYPKGDDGERKNIPEKEKVVMNISNDPMDSGASMALSFFVKLENDWDDFFVYNEAGNTPSYILSLEVRIESVRLRDLNMCSIGSSDDLFNHGIRVVFGGYVDLKCSDAVEKMVYMNYGEIVKKGHEVYEQTVGIAHDHLANGRIMYVPTASGGMVETLAVMKLAGGSDSTDVANHIWEILYKQNRDVADGCKVKIPDIIMICTILAKEPAVSIAVRKRSPCNKKDRAPCTTNIRVDLAEFHGNASGLGGGGHDAACAFKVKLDTFRQWEACAKLFTY